MHNSILIEVNITEEQIERAEKLYDFNNIKNSFTKGKSQIYGALGEIIVIDYLNLTKDNYLGNRNADLIIEGKTYDVKTKKVNSKPKLEYLNSIAINSLVQKCDAYIFVRVKTDMSKAWICGQINKSDFMTKAFYGVKDQPDPDNSNFTFKEDCMNLKISECDILEKKFNLLDEIKKRFKVTAKKNFYTGKSLDNEKTFILNPKNNLLIIKCGKTVIFRKEITKKEIFLQFLQEMFDFM